MSRTKKVLKNSGKYLVFGILMGLGGMVLTDMMVLPLVHGWSWLLGEQWKVRFII
jgi:hypothetical protein